MLLLLKLAETNFSWRGKFCKISPLYIVWCIKRDKEHFSSAHSHHWWWCQDCFISVFLHDQKNFFGHIHPYNPSSMISNCQIKNPLFALPSHASEWIIMMHSPLLGWVNLFLKWVDIKPTWCHDKFPATPFLHSNITTTIQGPTNNLKRYSVFKHMMYLAS